MIAIATVQALIGSNVRENGTHIRDSLLQAACQGAQLVHVPEAALSGYVGDQVSDWESVDWAIIQAELRDIAALARRLGIWVVLGCNDRLPRRRGHKPVWPQNCLFVISDQGVIAGRYAKRLCSNTELTYWYTPGVDPLIFDVQGIRFGCALCIEVVFPHLFTEYERLGVHCMLLSSYSANPIHGVMAQAHAATNGYWLSLSTPVQCSAGLSTTLFGPDGSILATCPPGRPGMIVRSIDPDDERFRVPVRFARPWRARARSGDLHAPRAIRLPDGPPHRPAPVTQKR